MIARALIAAWPALLLLTGCAARPTDLDHAHTRGLDRADAFVGRTSLDRAQDRPPATIIGEPVTWAELAPLLAEAAGGEVLREIALDRALVVECAARGVDPAQLADAGALARERVLLAAALRTGAIAETDDDSARIVQELRKARGLGEERFTRLLRRSALLRALVRDEVVVRDEALRTMYELRYGSTRRVRIIVTPTLDEAQTGLDRCRQGEDFSRLALEVSVDSSARTGGVIAPLSAHDPSWPLALRVAAFEAPPHTPIGPIAVEIGYVLLLVDGEDPPQDPPGFETVRPALEREAREREERTQMDRLARRLLGGARVETADPALIWSWRALQGP